MHSAVEKVSDLELKINISVPANELQSAYGKKVNDVARTAKVSGFRPGKVPVSYIKKCYGPSIEAEVVDEIVRKSFDQVCNEKQIAVAGIDNVDVTQREIGKDLEFTVRIEVYPEILFNNDDFANIKVEKNIVKVSDQDVDQALEKLLKANANWESTASDTKAKLGDKVVIDFKGEQNGKEIDDAGSEDFELELGSNHLIPGFEEGIVGHKAGDEFELKLKFPDDYHVVDFAATDVLFKISLKAVKHPVIPEIDKSFCQRFGVLSSNNNHEPHVHTDNCQHDHEPHVHTADCQHDQSHDQSEDNLDNDLDFTALFKAKLKESLEKEAENRAKIDFKNNILTSLRNHKAISIPKSAIEAETNSLIKQQQERYKKQIGSIKGLRFDRDKFAEQAKNNVHTSLLVLAFIKQNNIKTNRDIVKSKLCEMIGVDASTISDELLDWYYSDAKRLDEINAMALEDMVIAELENRFNITEKTVSYSELDNNRN